MMLLKVVAIFLVGSVASVKKQPDHKEDKTTCTRWQGTVSGNDPSVSVSVTLCDVGKGRVNGTLVWESKTSGSSTRRVEGSRSGGTLSLADISLTGKPNPGWMFCKVDRYSLSGSNDELSGSYHSEACHDDATIKLERVR